jgi:formylglycine-generating enzyme required for sulfatase activity
MKNLMLSFFTLLLFAAAATTTATAQDPKPKLAVLVVGMDDWMIGDVLAHLVGEELNRDKTYDVVTRRNDVQNKLEALRRGNGKLDDDLLRTWATGIGISNLCLVTAAHGLNFSLRLLDVSSGEVYCGGSNVEPNAVSLKQLAWSLAGNLGDVCTPSGPVGDYYAEPLLEVVVELEMVYVEGGTFTMGCVSGRDDINSHTCDNSEKPSHSVSVGSFWIGKYEVTQGQWEAVMGTTVSQQLDKSEYSGLYGAGSTYPMYYVSWDDAQAFCDTLSARTGRSYRLPTEEEWEYAARGGNSGSGYVYSGGSSIGSVAWYYGNASSGTRAVGGKSGNELGIYDMSGNVYEWCSSNWRANYSSSENGSSRVIRGGSWSYRNASGCPGCRVAYRYNYGPSSRDSAPRFSRGLRFLVFA